MYQIIILNEFRNKYVNKESYDSIMSMQKKI